MKISLKFVHKGQINNIPALVQIMAWRRPGDKPLFESMMVRLPTHICVTRPQCVKTASEQSVSVASEWLTTDVTEDVTIAHYLHFVNNLTITLGLSLIIRQIILLCPDTRAVHSITYNPSCQSIWNKYSKVTWNSWNAVAFNHIYCTFGPDITIVRVYEKKNKLWWFSIIRDLLRPEPAKALMVIFCHQELAKLAWMIYYTCIKVWDVMIHYHQLKLRSFCDYRWWWRRW